jgi:hypothetical protein
VEMAQNRARRSLLKAVGIMAAALAGTAGSYKPAAAKHDDEGGGGTCFLRGTRIRTADGYRPIETLSVGDRVAAHFAGHASITGISSFTLRRTGPAGSWAGASRPVCVKRGALGENLPAADICLTASHAVFRDGFLIPIGNLVNGTSIVLDTAEGHDTLDFFHLELDGHDVLYAEGAACESLRRAWVQPCMPLLGFRGGRNELRSRLRSMVSIVVDRRQPLDLIRDDLEERGLQLARAA